MLLLAYISSHGFGHATRTLAVLERVAALNPDARLAVRSQVPAWFLRHSGPPALHLHEGDTDTGVAQIDALALDEQATADRAAAFYRTFDDRVAREAAFIADLAADVVIGDIPPLAFAAAAAAGVRSVAIGNFTWDWIFERYETFDSAAPGVLPRIRDAYAHTTLALRLPFSGGFEPMQTATVDIPLAARQSRRGRDETRRLLGLPDDAPVILGSFGGHRTAIPYDEIARRARWTLLVTDHEMPAASHGGRLRRLTPTDLDAYGLRYEDLVAAADVVVSKPGYGIVSECIANDTALLYTSRGRFAELDVMVPMMPRVMRARFIDQEPLRAGDWQDAIDALLAQPPPPERMRIDGADVAARAILELARTSR